MRVKSNVDFLIKPGLLSIVLWAFLLFPSLDSTRLHSEQLRILTNLPLLSFSVENTFTFFSYLFYKLYLSESYFWLILGQEVSVKVPLLDASIEISILTSMAMHCYLPISQLYWIHLEVSTVSLVSSQCIAYFRILSIQKVFLYQLIRALRSSS